MSDDDTKINLLVLSAENDFQLKMINTNLQDIATQLKPVKREHKELQSRNKPIFKQYQQKI